MWERWHKGDTLHPIAQLFNRNHSSMQGILAQTGGIHTAPRIAAPAHADRSLSANADRERESVSRKPGLLSLSSSPLQYPRGHVCCIKICSKVGIVAPPQTFR